MEADADEVVFDAPEHFRIYKSGRIDRFHKPVLAAAGVDDASGVASKDVVIDAGTGLSVSLFLPKLDESSTNKKLPVLVYFHGGGFFIETPKSTTYHTYVGSLAAAAGVLAVSVDYRLAPEHRLPAAYDDCWAALRWAASAERDEWIAEHGDTAGGVFVAGDSAGGNIVHNVLVRASACADGGGAPRIEGAVLLHPFFGGSAAIEGEPERAVAIAEKVWAFACPDAAAGVDDPRINPTAPGAAPALERLGCERVLVCAGEKDWLTPRARAYHDAVAASGWPGSVAWLETEGEEHVFFLQKPECDKAKALMDRVAAFIAGA